MKSMVFRMVMFSLVVTGGCMTPGHKQNPLQDRVLYVLQEQKTQAEIQQQMQNRLADLEIMLKDIERKLSEAVVQHDESIHSVTKEIPLADEPWQTRSAGRMGTLDAFRFSFDEIVGEVKEHARKIEAIEKKLSEIDKDVQKTGIQGKLISEKRRQVQETTPQKEKKPMTPGAYKNVSPEYLYEQALEAFDSQEYQKAVNLWNEMVGGFPGHKLVSGAYFWQGEAYYQVGDFDMALRKYHTVIEKYGESRKYPSALLKAGLSCYALNKSREGRLFLEELIRKFPGKAEAKRAEIFLKNR